MIRSVTLLLALSAPAMAQGKSGLCEVSSKIAGLAVSERAAGEPHDKTVRAITADLQGPEASYAAAVQPIVDWVYTLPQEQLTDEVAPAYKAACLAQ